MSMKMMKRYGWLLPAWLLLLGLIWMGPRVSGAQEADALGFRPEQVAPPEFLGLVAQEEDQGDNQEEPALAPGPAGRGMNRPGPGNRPRRGQRGMDRPMRERPGMGQGMGPGGGRRFDDMLERMKTEDPERYARITKIRELSDQYRTSTDANDKKKIEKDLRPLLETELKQIQTDNQKKIEDLERRLNDEKRKQKERDQNWNAYVNYQFNHITGESDYLQMPIGPWK